MVLSLGEVISDFADAFKAVDETRPQGASRRRTYRPGIGPLTEADALNRVLQHLKEGTRPSYYRDASPKRYPSSRKQCDLVIPGEWAIEFKLLRPFVITAQKPNIGRRMCFTPTQATLAP